MKKCPNCSKKIEENWKICPFCGEDLGKKPTSNIESNVIYYSHNPFRRERTAIIKSLSLHPGQELDRFKLKQKIGEGSESTVWLVSDLELHQNKALKIIPLIKRNSDDFISIYNELSNIDNQKHIIKMERPVECRYLCQDLIIIPLEYATNGNLRKKLDRLYSIPDNREKEDELIKIAVQIINAMTELHKANLLHLDLKPENILFGEQYVKLTDFSKEEKSLIKVDNSVDFDLNPYSAPEQFNTDIRRIDERSDIYSFGVMLYEMFTDGIILARNNDFQVDRKYFDEENYRCLPESLTKIIDNCIKKYPRERYHDISDIKADLDSVIMELELNRKKSDALMENAEIMLNEDRFDKSEQYIKKAIELEPRNQIFKEYADNIVSKKIEILNKKSQTQRFFSEKDFVFIPKTEFTMGNIKGERSELPEHKVILEPYYISKFPVKLSEWKIFVNQFYEDFDWQSNSWGESVKKYCNKNNHPIINVSWFEAIEFCNWKSREEGFQECYKMQAGDYKFDVKANGYRLPTEAEWENAAKSAGRGCANIYAGSSKSEEVAWTKEKTSSLKEVGLFQPNELGVYDMSGNVLEWCWDWFSETFYNESDLKNPLGPNEGRKKVLRGGAWNLEKSVAKVYSRHRMRPKKRREFVGLRICRSDL